ncbi:MAG: hypothetical protein JW966_12525 [Anaerolineae bacterium]|nr:hypothetical protein [Anaerolineae bacterium]
MTRSKQWLRVLAGVLFLAGLIVGTVAYLDRLGIELNNLFDELMYGQSWSYESSHDTNERPSLIEQVADGPDRPRCQITLAVFALSAAALIAGALLWRNTPYPWEHVNRVTVISGGLAAITLLIMMASATFFLADRTRFSFMILPLIPWCICLLVFVIALGVDLVRWMRGRWQRGRT